ncbi:MAG: hypothetical protein HZB83_00975 [Deltaproteobacteria bacterium]|nr:hypothetical protein [Deltaproteobacteria bacterium]
MNLLEKLLKEPLSAARRRRNLIVFFIIAHTVFLVFGEWAVAKGIPSVLGLREELLKELRTLPYLQPLTGALANSLILKIIYTFFFNLLIGALVSTTVTGLIFFLPYVIAVWRSFTVGLLFHGLGVTPLQTLVFYGTFILEFGGYCISSAAGTDMGLALIWPERKGTKSRKDAFLISLRDASSLYLLVILLLFVAAVWEMSWLEYLGPLIRTDAPIK